jgi:histidine triad (HIT) family protein
MASCIFCDIIRGEAAASSVFRNDLVSAFLDISPVTPGHTLVVPNAHAELLRDMRPDVRYELFHIALEVGEALRRSGLRVDGLNFFVAEGEAAGQDVFHSHIHVLPRYPGDGFVVDAEAWRHPAPSREELDGHAAAIRAGITSTGEL